MRSAVSSRFPVRHGTRLSSTGFTLVETLVVLTVLLVIVLSFVPAMSDRLDQHRVANVANDLLAAVRQARSEALSRRARVAVAPQVGRDWGSGWRVFVDSDNDGSLDPGELVLGEFPAPPAGVSISPNFGVTFAGQYLSFDESGYPQRSGSEGLLLGRLNVRGASHERVLCVSAATVRLRPGASC